VILCVLCGRLPLLFPILSINLEAFDEGAQTR
jgi:hypothetical protein